MGTDRVPAFQLVSYEASLLSCPTVDSESILAVLPLVSNSERRKSRRNRDGVSISAGLRKSFLQFRDTFLARPILIAPSFFCSVSYAASRQCSWANSASRRCRPCSFIILIFGAWPITFHSSALCSIRRNVRKAQL